MPVPILNTVPQVSAMLAARVVQRFQNADSQESHDNVSNKGLAQLVRRFEEAAEEVDREALREEVVELAEKAAGSGEAEKPEPPVISSEAAGEVEKSAAQKEEEE